MHELAIRAKSELLDLCVSPEGWFYASGAQNTGQGDFHCLFGRDACITSLLLLDYIKASGDTDFLLGIRRTLEKLADTAGRGFNRLTGEKPGWIVHEIRTDVRPVPVNKNEASWPVDDDGVMRIYQSLDATPLYLIAMHRYFEMTGEEKWLASQMYAVKNALRAILDFGDNNRDGLVDYTVPVERTSGGLIVQNWMDSTESLGEGRFFPPIAPLEVQGYVWLAFKLWSDFLFTRGLEQGLVSRLILYASGIIAQVQNNFLVEENGMFYLAAYLDGRGRKDKRPRSSMGHLLWATTQDKNKEGVLGNVGGRFGIQAAIVSRLMAPDMFDLRAGIRTLSAKAPRYNPKQYHNGAIWPHDNAMIYLGLRNCGFIEEASMVAKAVFQALEHFDVPGMELYCLTSRGYGEFRHSGGNPCNREQAWALAGVLAMDAWENWAKR